jgi:hypothetical protein
MYGEKTNIRSFRYSDEVATAIERADGSNLNEKFNNLIQKCYFDIPAKEKELKEWQDKITKKRDEYFDLCKELEQVHHLIQTLQTLEHYGETAARQAENITKGFDEKGYSKK